MRLFAPPLPLLTVGWSLVCLVVFARDREHRLSPPRNLTILRKTETRHRDTGKVLLFVTAVVKSMTGGDHLAELTHLWPFILTKSQLLGSADLVLHIAYNPRDAVLPGPPGATSHTLHRVGRTDPHALRSVTQIAQSFPNNYIRVFFVENPGYQSGAIKCMRDAVELDLFQGYDW